MPNDDDDPKALGERLLRSLQQREADPDLEEAASLFRRVVKRLSTREPAFEQMVLLHEDGLQNLLPRFVQRVQRALRRAGCAPIEHVVSGPLASKSLSPTSASFHGAAAIIGVPQVSLIFMHLFSKAVGPLVAKPEGGRGRRGRILLGRAPRPTQRREAFRRLQELFAAVAAGNAAKAPSYLRGPGWTGWPVASALCDAVEFFAVAHEYGHLLFGHQHVELHGPADADDRFRQVAEEVACDCIAMRAAICDWGSGRPLMGRVVGPLAFMRMIDILQQGGLLPIGDGHPPAAERYEQIHSTAAPAMLEAGVRRVHVDAVSRVIEQVDRLTTRACLEALATYESIDLEEERFCNLQAIVARHEAATTTIE